MTHAPEKRRGPAVAVIALAVLSLVLSACGSDGANDASSPKRGPAPKVAFSGSIEGKVPVGYPMPEPRSLRIGFLSPGNEVEAFQTVSKAFELETKRLGGRPVVLSAHFDPDRQVTQFQQLIDSRVDGIFVFAFDPRSVTPLVKAAKAARIPVIAVEHNVDSPTAIGDLTSQIWYGIDQMTYLQARELAQLLPRGAKVGRIFRNVPAPVITQLNTQTPKWLTRFGLTLVGGVENRTDDVPGGETAMNGLLAKHGDVEGVVVANDEGAIGAAAAARQRGRKLPIVGLTGGSGGFDAVETGRITATVQWDTVGLGILGARGLYDAAEGRKLAKTVRTRPPRIVNGPNVAEVPRWQTELTAIEDGKVLFTTD